MRFPLINDDIVIQFIVKMKKVKIGILGCANIAQKYAIKAFQSIGNAEVVSVASRDYEKAKEWAFRFGLKAEQSYDVLIMNPEIDAIYIPLPIGLHKEWIIKAAKNGKDIICEKSLAGSLADVKEILSVCDSNEIILYENFMCDFHPQHQEVLSLIKKGEIGKPFVFRGYFGFPMMDQNNFRYSRELGGGCLNDAGSYTVFMARKIFGKEPVSVSANMFYDKEKEVDMKGSAQLDFEYGVSAIIAFSFNAMYQNNYSVWGEKGLINVARAYAIPPDMKPEVFFTKNENMKEKTIQLDISAANHFELIFSDFCDTILHRDKHKGKIKNIYSNMLNQAKTLEAIRISSKENRKVKISDLN